MNDIKSIGFALDPTSSPSFLLDWELTRLCNLNCTYCGDGPEGGHDNSTQHPPLAECLASIDFMYQYVSEYMQYKRPTQRKVVLNVYGGESLFHPDIVQILQACRDRHSQYKDAWHLTITCTTNGIVGTRRWTEIVPLIDEFTVSYHAESLPKQQQQYRDNVLYLKQQDCRFKCVIMMHNNPIHWQAAMQMAEFCQTHGLRHIMKPLDNWKPGWEYTTEQFEILKNQWTQGVSPLRRMEYKKSMSDVGQDAALSIHEGRPCCGGRKLSLNNDLKSSVTFVPRQGFTGWSCSVNWFFLFVQQQTGLVYTNKDCKMSTTGVMEPLGSLTDADGIIGNISQQLSTGNMPVIICAKDICRCGFCAPKAESSEDFFNLIGRHVTSDVFVRSK